MTEKSRRRVPDDPTAADILASLEAQVADGLLERGPEPGTYRMTKAGKAYVESMGTEEIQ